MDLAVNLAVGGTFLMTVSTAPVGPRRVVIDLGFRCQNRPLSPVPALVGGVPIDVAAGTRSAGIPVPGVTAPLVVSTPPSLAAWKWAATRSAGIALSKMATSSI